MGNIKDQGKCGSCWAFAAVGCVEAQWAMAGNSAEILSEQMLIDCSYGDCDGGWVNDAFDTIYYEGGECRESSYPYTATNGNFHLI